MQAFACDALIDAMQIHRALAPAHVLLCAIVVFIVYGSLFPFVFQAAAKPIAELFTSWNPFLDRADAIDNILLFIPLGLTLHFSFDWWAARWLAAVLAWVALGLGLQWGQLFVPSRTPSLADAVNNAIGLVVGMAIAHLIAPWLKRQQLLNTSGDLFALLLVAAWYGYESFPFLPTLDVGLLGGHIKSAFQATHFDALRLVRHTVAATLGIMLLLRANVLRQRWANVAAAAIVALLSEILVPYGGLRVETLLGIVGGIAVGERLDRRFGANSYWLVMPLALAALAITVMTPFRGQPAASTFTFTPFSGLLWYGTTSGIPPTAFEALAIGALLWSGLSHRAGANAGSRHWPWAVLALLVAAELIRVHVLGYRGDTTTFFLWAILAPIAVMARRPRATALAAKDEWPSPATNQVDPATRKNAPGVARPVTNTSQPMKAARDALIGLLCLTLGLWLVFRLPSIPYNLRDLFGPNRWPGIVLFSVALLWLGFGPWWVACTAVRLRAAALWLPALLCIASMASLLLLKLSVTEESLGDITGSTALFRNVVEDNYWRAEWRERFMLLPAALVDALERGVRFGALYNLLLIPLTAAAICSSRRWRFSQALAALPIALACWWLAKCVVIDWTITDNLVELIAPDGVPYLAVLLLAFAAHATALIIFARIRHAPALTLVTVAALPASWWLLSQGLEPVIVKYGIVFSAAQFLLGANRTELLNEAQLFLRWCVLYLAAIGTIAWGMRLAVRLMPPAPRLR